MVHFNEPYLTVRWDEDANAVWAEWKDSAQGELLRRGLEAGLELILLKKSRRWLADARRLGPMGPADVKWVNDVWTPQVVAGGLRWMVVIAPKKVVVQLAVRSYMSRINEQELGTAYFDDLEDARAWLRSQQ